MLSQEHIFYVYVYLNPLKPGKYEYQDKDGTIYIFNYEPFYVGKGHKNRLKSHLRLKGVNNLKNNIIKKILNKQFSPIIFKIKENLSEQEALNLERNIIISIGRRDLKEGTLANMSDGGSGNYGYNHSIKSKLLMSQAKLGYNPWNKGKLLDDDYRAKISKSLKGIKQSDATKNKRRETFENKSKTEKLEISRKISIAMKSRSTEDEKNRITRMIKNSTKDYLLRLPNGESIIFQYGLKALCKKYHISLKCAKRYMNKGIVPHSNVKTEKRVNLTGCIIMEIK